MCDSLNQSMLLQQNEHGSNGAGIRRHTAGEVPLGERLSSCERCEENELVGGDSMRRELCLCTAMEHIYADRSAIGSSSWVAICPLGEVVRIRTFSRVYQGPRLNTRISSSDKRSGLTPTHVRPWRSLRPWRRLWTRSTIAGQSNARRHVLRRRRFS